MNSRLGITRLGRCGRIVLAVLVLSAIAGAQNVESLPAPTVHGNSFEIISNSRYSVHYGFDSTLSRQVLSNVLWAMNRVPMLGSYREIYVATQANVYLYDTLTNTMNVYLAGKHLYNSTASFEVGIACPRNEEAGYAIQAGLLAGDAFWDSSGGSVVSCPQQYATNNDDTAWQPTHPIMMVAVFGQGTATGLTSVCQAVSSDSSLPRPHVTGSDTFEKLISNLHQDSAFDRANLPIDAVSQLLWAGNGVTPHQPFGGRRGLTIPSAVANYYLTRKVYLVTDTAVMRYDNRLPPDTNLKTSDHRLELVKSGDRRDSLRAASPLIPPGAPMYIVVCVADTSLNWAVLEAGFAGFQYLMQAEALGLRGWLFAPIAPPVRTAIITALGLPVTDLPVLVFACGASGTGVTEQPQVRGQGSGLGGQGLWLRVSGNRAPLQIEYSLGATARAKLAILDLAGRLVRDFSLASQSSGPLSLEWDGKDGSGRLVPAGIYVCRLEAAGAVSTARIVLVR